MHTHTHACVAVHMKPLVSPFFKSHFNTLVGERRWEFPGHSQEGKEARKVIFMCLGIDEILTALHALSGGLLFLIRNTPTGGKSYLSSHQWVKTIFLWERKGIMHCFKKVGVMAITCHLRSAESLGSDLDFNPGSIPH